MYDPGNMVSSNALFDKIFQRAVVAKASRTFAVNGFASKPVFFEAKPKVSWVHARPLPPSSGEKFLIRWRNYVLSPGLAKNGECRTRECFWEKRRNRGRHSRYSLSQRFKLTKKQGCRKNRARFDENCAAARLDTMESLAHLAWTSPLFARKPDCANCEVFALCPSGKIFLRTGEAKKT